MKEFMSVKNAKKAFHTFIVRAANSTSVKSVIKGFTTKVRGRNT